MLLYSTYSLNGTSLKVGCFFWSSELLCCLLGYLLLENGTLYDANIGCYKTLSQVLIKPCKL